MVDLMRPQGGAGSALKLGLAALTGGAGAGLAGAVGASGLGGAAINAGLAGAAGNTPIGRALNAYSTGKSIAGGLGGGSQSPGAPSPTPGQPPSLGVPQLEVSPDISAMQRRLASYGSGY